MICRTLINLDRVDIGIDKSGLDHGSSVFGECSRSHDKTGTPLSFGASDLEIYGFGCIVGLFGNFPVWNNQVVIVTWGHIIDASVSCLRLFMQVMAWALDLARLSAGRGQPLPRLL